MKRRWRCLLGWHEFVWFDDTNNYFITEYDCTIRANVTEMVKFPVKRGTCVGPGCKEIRTKFRDELSQET